MIAELEPLYDLLAGLEGDDQSYFAVLAGLMSILANREPREETVWEPDRVISPTSLVDEAITKLSFHIRGLAAMDLKPAEYLEAYLALYRGDIEMAKQIVDLRKSADRPAKPRNWDVEQINKVVDPYIQAQVEKVKPGGEAKLVFVVGPYASGKTELPK